MLSFYSTFGVPLSIFGKRDRIVVQRMNSGAREAATDVTWGKQTEKEAKEAVSCKALKLDRHKISYRFAHGATQTPRLSHATR